MKKNVLVVALLLLSAACGEKFKSKVSNDGFFVKPDEAVQIGSFYIEPQATSKGTSIVETLVTIKDGTVSFSQVQTGTTPVRTETVYAYENSGPYFKLTTLVSKSNCEVSQFSSEVGAMIAAKKMKGAKYKFVMLKGQEFNNGVMHAATEEEKARIKSVKECEVEAPK